MLLPFHELLQRALREGSVVVIVGAGVSKAVADLPGWQAALSRALAHLAEVGTASDVELHELRARITEATSPRDLTQCAAEVRRLLTGASNHSGEFAAWLQETFNVPTPSSSALGLIRAIHSLGASLVTTTNYDKLLSLGEERLESATWQEPHKLISAFDNGS